MKGPILYATRQAVIEGRRNAGSLLAPPSLPDSAGYRQAGRPLHYVPGRPVASGVWKSQKSQEQIYLNGELIWELFLIEMIHRKVPNKWRKELRGFLDLVYKEKIDDLWLDTDFRFWTPEWSEWSFDYKSDGNFELYQGTAKVFRKSNHLYTGICVAGIIKQ